MIQKIIFNAPTSALSLGQVSFNILRELYKRKIQVAFFPIGNPDFSAFKVDPQFGAWLEQAANQRYHRLDRKIPTLKVWHIRDSEARLSDKQYLLSFHELDQCTGEEISVVNHQDHTFFTSSWSVDNFKTFGASNVSYVPLGIDEDFVPAPHRIMSDDVIHTIMVGKHEDLRKMTSSKLVSWMKKYANKKEYQLTLCVNNPFYRKETCGVTTDDLLNRVFAAAGGKPFNITVLPPLKTNSEMLRVYQSADLCVSGHSRGEAANIPSMTTTALGKWSIVSNCSGHKDWATAENSILVEPTGMIKAVDNFFFQEGAQFSRGNMFDFAPDAFDKALDEAEKRAKTPNPAGEKLRETHTYAKTLDAILEKIGD